jgi:hypothetical protein
MNNKVINIILISILITQALGIPCFGWNSGLSSWNNWNKWSWSNWKWDTWNNWSWNTQTSTTKVSTKTATTRVTKPTPTIINNIPDCSKPENKKLPECAPDCSKPENKKLPECAPDCSKPENKKITRMCSRL